MDISNAEGINDFITFSDDATCFAKNQRMAKQAKAALDKLMETEQKDIQELKDIIVNTYFDEQDRDAAREIIEEFGMSPNKNLKDIITDNSKKIVELLNNYSPKNATVETDATGSYYIDGKGYGYYTDTEGQYVDEGNLGAYIKEETKNWTWHKAKEKENLVAKKAKALK